MVRVSINVLCLVGAAIGILALFVPWYYVTGGANRSYENPLAPGELEVGVLPHCWSVVFSILVVGGGAASVVTPLGGFMQASGVLLFLYRFSPTGGFFFPEARLIPYIGPALAILSISFVLASLVWPLGLGYADPFSLRSRLVTVCRQKDSSEGRVGCPGMKDVLRVVGVALLLGGVCGFAYAFRAAHAMDSYSRFIAHDTLSLLNLLGILCAEVAALGCAFFFISRGWNSRSHQIR